MSDKFQKTKPSFLEGGLPCSSLSAECQRDNNARQRPPQNRLHIWWARRPPTISRAAVLSAVLPFDYRAPAAILPSMFDEPSEADLDDLPAKHRKHEGFYRRLLEEVAATELTAAHADFLRVLGIRGDSSRAYRRMALREEYLVGNQPILLPMDWTYRHPPAYRESPSPEVLAHLLKSARSLLGLGDDEPVVALDFMAGGGSIPLEAVRYGMKVYANDLNPVAALVLKSTIEYPTRHGPGLVSTIQRYAEKVAERVRARLEQFFYIEPPAVWWEFEADRARDEFSAKAIVDVAPADRDSSTNCTLWCRTVRCTKCDLNVPIATNFYVRRKKGRPELALAAFPDVPPLGAGVNCTFRLVSRSQWSECRWPKPGFTKWHPVSTPTYKNGTAECPRCGTVMDSGEVKLQAQERPGGLSAQIFAVISKVPVRTTYDTGESKVRYMWRFRAPTEADIEAVEAAEAELSVRAQRWEANGLLPTEEVPDDMEDRRPREYGMRRWCDMFLPRQLLSNMVVLEEVREAQAAANRELPPHEAEAVGVYLALVHSKIASYNSAQCSWHDSRSAIRGTFMGHDFRFHASSAEMEGSREMVGWATAQVVGAYRSLSMLVHGGDSTSAGDVDDFEDDTELDSSPDDDDDSESSSDGLGEDESDDLSDHGVASSVNTHEAGLSMRQDVVVPTVTNQDAAALSVPAPGSVHLICVDPPYYNNVQYAELSNFFYVWLKRALGEYSSLTGLFNEPLADTNREAVANAARWQSDAEREQAAWQQKFDATFERLYAQRVPGAGGRMKKRYTQKAARELAVEMVGPKPASAKERADAFYEDKMASVFRRAKRLLHPAGRMVVMFNHKQTWAWRSLGMALIRAGFEVRSSIPIHTEAESSLNIRGLDAARSTVLLMCMPREEKEQSPGNWGTVQSRVERIARAAAERFQAQGLDGTDLYLSALGPALGEVGRNWPVTDFAGRDIDLVDALEVAYKSVGQWRLSQLLTELTSSAEFHEAAQTFSADAVDRDTQTLWLWLDTFKGETADSDDVRKLAKSLGVDPDDFKRMGLLDKDKQLFVLRAPQDTDHRLLSLRLRGESLGRGRAARAADAWEERVFPNFVGAAAWNAIGLMAGGADGPRGADALRRWLRESGYGSQREFIGAYAVTLNLLERVFARRRKEDHWAEATLQARRGWDLVLRNWRV